MKEFFIGLTVGIVGYWAFQQINILQLRCDTLFQNQATLMQNQNILIDQLQKDSPTIAKK